MNQQLQLLGDRIIARLITKQFTDGGIVLPESAGNTDNTRLADVLYVGPGRTLTNGTLVETVVKPFQRVIMDFGGGWVKLDDELLISASERNVLAILD
jgi:co-chaperonin GroES (HSP10)